MKLRTWAALGTAVAGLGMSGVSLAQAKFNLDKPHLPDQLIISFHEQVKAEHSLSLLARAGMKPMHTYKSGHVLVQLPRAFAESELEATATALMKTGAVRSVEANTILTISARTPNDVRFGELYGLHNTGATGGTVNADIDAPEAWEISTGSRDVLVGIIDTGVDYNHPDIAPNYWTNPGESGLDANGNDKRTNGIDDDGNGFVDDWRGWDFVNNDNDPMDDNDHGTHCAGTIGANGNDGVGVVGVNWEVSMVGIKFLSGAGSGSLADAVKAIDYGTTINATMTSNSWGGGGFSDAMDAAIRNADAKGVLFIAAAGNSSANNDRSPHYPSSYAADNVIAVAATDHNDNMASFSSYGATTVDLGAPGVNILSSTPNNGYKSFSGTSMATPHVAGVAALVKAAFPDATAAQIKARLLNTVDPVPALAGKTLTGGRVNALNALEIDSIAPGTVRNLALSAAGTTWIELNWLAAGDDGDEGTASRYEVRYAAEPIDSDEAWDAASVAAIQLAGNDSGELTGRIVGLPFNSNGFVAIKAVDNVGNIGPMSNSLPFNVLRVTKVGGHDADTLDGVTADTPWGLEQVGARNGNVFSDSPAGNYADDANTSLTLAPIAISNANVTLNFSVTYDFEANYDFGIVEVSKDGGATFTVLERLTGAGAWQDKSYDLSGFLADASELTVRFRVTSDYSITKDGWKIDDIAFYAPAE